jgi:hypothetical protein
MRRTIVSILVLSLLVIQSPVHAGIEGTNCWSKGQTRKVAGMRYECKLVNGKFKWQVKLKKPALTEAQKQKAWTDCVVSLIGTAGFSNDDLINSAYICRQRLGFGY